MAIITNLDGNVMLELNLIKNGFLDINQEKHDTECWIPFEFVLKVEEQKFVFGKDANVFFTLYEISNFINHNIEQIAVKRSGSIEDYEFNSSQCYFQLRIYDTLEPNQIYIDIWINIGEYTKGNVFGYDKGFRFVVDVSVFNDFNIELKDQLEHILA